MTITAVDDIRHGASLIRAGLASVAELRALDLRGLQGADREAVEGIIVILLEGAALVALEAAEAAFGASN